MSDQYKLNPGQGRTFSTRVAGHSTKLYAQASEEGECTVGWRAQVCCQQDETIKLEKGQSNSVDISKAGALVVVTNTGYHPVTVWTDY